jgi:hypothetical protein
MAPVIRLNWVAIERFVLWFCVVGVVLLCVK